MRPFVCAFLCLISARVHGAVYNVGPSQPLTSLFQVAWKNLQPGDQVNIYPKPGGYKEKIQISASGTAANHIVIHGVPDPTTGALPILEANGAIEDPSTDWRSAVLSPFGMITVSPRKTGYVYGSYHVSFVDIENLDIRDCIYTSDKSIPYTDQTGQLRAWDSFSCGIYIEWARDFAIRGCEIHNCGNGIFANSKNGDAQSSARLLIEKNYLHDNSLPATNDPNTGAVLSNGFHEHHIYTESAGVTIQYNRFGAMLPNAHGVAIKDRSSNEVIRYNEFDMTGESNVMALLDPQGGSGFIELQPHYQDSYVYGNLVTIENFPTDISLFWWGAYNSTSAYPSLHRGTLYFYNNTVVIHHPKATLFFLPSTNYTGSSATFENVDCRNNIFYVDPAGQSSVYSALNWFSPGATNGGGNINLGANWLSPGTQKDSPGHAYGGQLIGQNNLLVGDSAGTNDAHFVDMNAHNYHVLANANSLDADGGLAAAALPTYDDTQEYVAPQSFAARVTLGSGSDLGALESGGSGVAGPTPTPVPSPSPTVTPSPSATATPSITPTPSATATPSITPSPTPPALGKAVNISTRGSVGGNDQVMIGGVIVSGNSAKKVLLRGIGPSLTQEGVTDALADPVLELHLADGTVLTNNNWQETQQVAIQATGLAPGDTNESAISVSLPPGAHTVILKGKNGSIGTGLVEVYDLEPGNATALVNISTRGTVGGGDQVLIGGFILGGTSNNTEVAIRGLGASLAAAGVADAIADPALKIFDSHGNQVALNDNWEDDSTGAAILQTKGLAPKDDAEAACVLSLPAGAYTAILANNGGSGTGLIEVYRLQ